MKSANRKRELETIIKNKGNCMSVRCNNCPIRKTEVCEYLGGGDDESIIYKEAVKCYEKEYGIDYIVELLI